MECKRLGSDGRSEIGSETRSQLGNDSKGWNGGNLLKGGGHCSRQLRSLVLNIVYV